MTSNFVIAVSSISGGGKTTLVKNTATLLNATSLFFDHYISTLLGKKWVEDGADFNEIKTPVFSEDLAKLKKGENILSPENRTIIKPSEYIVIEEPTGRERKEMATLIDFCVFIDTPLDIGLVRRIGRDFLTSIENRIDEKKKAGELFFEVTEAEKGVASMREYIGLYHNRFRWTYLEQLKQVKTNCDLVLDGCQSPGEMARQLVEAVKGFRKK